MLKASWRSVLGHLPRFILSALAVVLGIAFMVGALTFTGMLRQSFNQLGTSAIPDIDISPAGTYDSTSMMASATGTLLPTSVIDEVARIDGVERADGVLTSMGVYALNSEGRVVMTTQAPGMGFSYMTAPAYGGQPGITIVEGRAPQQPGEVVVDPTTFDKLGIAIGDEITLATNEGMITRTLVGTGSWGGSSFGAAYTFFDPADAQAVLLPPGSEGFQMGWISLEESARDDASRQRIVEEINAILPSGWQATDGGEVAEYTTSFINQAMSYVNTFLMVFAVIGLVVAVFLIVNTFSILVAQRGRELALLRALGASQGQVSRSVLFEALVIGLLGAIGGLLMGVLLAWGISAAMASMDMALTGARPVPSTSTIIASLVVGIVVTVASAWLPARRGARVPPVAAMTGQIEDNRPGFGPAEVVASLLGIIGLGLVLTGAVWIDHDRALFVGIGAVLLLVSLALLGAIIGRPLLWALGALWQGLFRTPGRLAALNTARQPRRTAATAAALMIGLTLVSALSVLGSSASASIHSTAQDLMHDDFRITAAAMTRLPTTLPDTMAQVDGVGEVVVHRALYATDTNGDFVQVVGFAPDHFNAMETQTLASGRLFTDTVGEVIVSQEFADANDLVAGDQYPIINPYDRQPMTLDIVGVFTTPEGVDAGSINTSLETMAALGESTSASSIGILLDDGADPAQVREGLEGTLTEHPMVAVLDRTEFIDNQTAQIDALLNVIYALLGLAIVIAVLGIVNTLVLSTIERTRELGLLRAVGLQRSQLRTMITLESVAIAVLGAVLGVMLGIGVGAALQRTLSDSGLSVLGINWSLVAVCLVGSVLVGVIAAASPARRAARMRILDAIAHE